MLDPIYYAISAVMWFWHEVLGFLLGPTNGIAWALSVVFLVLTLRALMIKPMLAQMRSGRAMRALSPHMEEIRKRHADDPAKMLSENKKLREANGVKTAGTLITALVQIPVFLGLLHVLRMFNRPGLSFEQNAAIANYAFPADDVRSFLEARLFGAPLSSFLTMPQELLDSFGAHVDRWQVIAVVVPLTLIAAVATHFSARHSLTISPMDGPAASMMKLMPWIFPLGVLGGGLFFGLPVAVLVYWLTNNVWTLVQQPLFHRRLERQAAANPPPPVVVPAATAPGAAARAAPKPGAKPLPKREPGAGVATATKPRRHASGHRPSKKRR
ncbi:membrane protein insertase YidC [Pseudonocardia sp. TRM90224]|uniref:membrane protein insertase YidC n=1 Tax=Pseudonocardia sp. TRM90224 TaxID=2812678 RepID=UPI001E282F5A|nr:membrane protein insertase YidC [Pseudonocardia sp. TRM90224]